MVSALGFLVLLLPLVAGNFQPANNSTTRSVLRITRILDDGQLERITKWPGFCATETTVDWGDMEVTLREVWLDEAKLKVRLIYAGGILNDCLEETYEEMRRNGESEADCSSKLRLAKDDESRMIVDEVDQSIPVDVPSRGDLTPRHLAFWFTTADDLRRECFRIKTKARNQILDRQEKARSRRGIQEMMFAPGTKWCGPQHLASRYNDLGGLVKVDRCCRRHDHCHRAIPPLTQRYGYFNYMLFTLSHCGCDQRKYRDTSGTKMKSKHRRNRARTKIRARERGRGRRELLLVPGTQWCGRGHRATKYTNLGGFGAADACCRRHDTACPLYIPAFQTAYGLFNWGVSTLMHCACDERFRTCLKMAGTSSANFVGTLFFNMVQTKCFVLKRKKECVRRSWYGKCERFEYRKQMNSGFGSSWSEGETSFRV